MKGIRAFTSCPFCDEADGDNIEMSHDSRGAGDHVERFYFVECLSCGARGPTADCEARALVGWNIRHRTLEGAFREKGIET